MLEFLPEFLAAMIILVIGVVLSTWIILLGNHQPDVSHFIHELENGEQLICTGRNETYFKCEVI